MKEYIEITNIAAENEKPMPLIATSADRSILNNEVSKNATLSNQVNNFLIQKSNESECSRSRDRSNHFGN